MKFLLRRLGFYAMAAWVSITLAFIIPRMMPGDPATMLVARFKRKLDPAAIQALREAFGFTSGPLYKQYFTYIQHVFAGDFGVSLSHFPENVSEVIGGSMVWTMGLVGVAVVLSFLIGSALGAFGAFYRGGFLDNTMPPVLLFLGAFPFFWLAMLVLFVFGFTLGWFPVRHAYADNLTPSFTWPFLVSVAKHAMLPALTTVLATIGGWMVGMRNTMMNVLGDDYVTLACAKGLPARRVLWSYALRNALLPNVTSFGMAIGFVLSGSLLTEIVFSYPGQGYLLVRAVKSLDYPLIQGLFLTITLSVLAANWVVDAVYVWLDPRVR
jgi:peptide/nickel transport system permease protein